LYEIKKSDNFGRYLIAKNNIPEKTLILSECPLIHSPSDDCDTSAEKKDEDIAILFCLGCCLKLKNSEWIPCPECGWPLCSKSCKSVIILQIIHELL